MAFHRGVYRRSGLVTALAVAVTCSFCQPAPAQAANDHLIVPWLRIGPIALGMSGDDVMRIMGEPTKTMGGPPDGVNLYLWKDDLSVTVKKNGSYVTQICALSPAYATAQGVRPGLPEHAVTDLLGQPQNSRVRNAWWRFSYTDLFWGGLMITIPLTGYETNHSVRAVCVNHRA
jgi:hypothetical protein